jgi:hypothetical protein
MDGCSMDRGVEIESKKMKKRYKDELGPKRYSYRSSATAPESLLCVLTITNKTASTQIPL